MNKIIKKSQNSLIWDHIILRALKRKSPLPKEPKAIASGVASRDLKVKKVQIILDQASIYLLNSGV
jgi:hypothetical protein